jgi:hypothetical protein
MFLKPNDCLCSVLEEEGGVETLAHAGLTGPLSHWVVLCVRGVIGWCDASEEGVTGSYRGVDCWAYQSILWCLMITLNLAFSSLRTCIGTLIGWTKALNQSKPPESNKAAR